MRDKANTLIIGFDEPLARWACDRIPWADYGPTMRAVGVSAGPEASDRLLAVCVYHNYIPPKQIDGKTWFGICEISFAADSPAWASRLCARNWVHVTTTPVHTPKSMPFAKPPRRWATTVWKIAPCM